MKKYFLLLVLWISVSGFSQSLNDYQYVIVPSKFTILKVNNRYNLNTNVKLLLQKYGFKAFLNTDSIPNEIANANCKKVYADVVKENTLLMTKIKIVIKDCRERVLFETAFGSSREKALPVAYNQALREAAKSFESLKYTYNGKNGYVAEELTETSKEQSNVLTKTNDSAEGLYLAQPIENGYQLVDNDSKVIMKLMNTSQKNVFMGIKGDVNGTVILKNGHWFFEYYKNGSLVSEPLNLKF